MTDLEAIGANRAKLFRQIDELLAASKANAKDAAKNQSSLFGGVAVASISRPQTDIKPWSTRELLANEKEVLGFYITAHPLDYFADTAITALVSHTIDQLTEIDDKARVRLCGVPQNLEIKMGKSGKRYCMFKIEDRTGSADCVAWQEALNKFETTLLSSEPIFVSGKLDKNDERFVVVIDKIELVSDSVATIKHEA